MKSLPSSSEGDKFWTNFDTEDVRETFWSLLDTMGRNLLHVDTQNEQNAYDRIYTVFIPYEYNSEFSITCSDSCRNHTLMDGVSRSQSGLMGCLCMAGHDSIKWALSDSL